MLRMLTLAALVLPGLGLTPVRGQTPDWTIPDAQLTALRWTDIEGWKADDHAAAFDTFLASCKAVVAGRKATREARPIDAPLKAICGEALALGPATAAEAREFFES